MGCGSSKNVKVDSHQQEDKANDNEHQQNRDIEASNRECIDRENGETLTRDTYVQDKTRTSPDGEAQADDGIREQIPSRDETPGQAAPSTTPTQDSDYKQPIDSVSSKQLFDFSCRSILHVIRQGLYVNDMRDLIRLKNQNWLLEEEIRLTLLESGKPPPPITAKEAGSENPRRVRPPRNHLREIAFVVALELDMVFDIINKNLYAKNTEMFDQFREQERELKEEMKRINSDNS